MIDRTGGSRCQSCHSKWFISHVLDLQQRGRSSMFQSSSLWLSAVWAVTPNQSAICVTNTFCALFSAWFVFLSTECHAKICVFLTGSIVRPWGYQVHWRGLDLIWYLILSSHFPVNWQEESHTLTESSHLETEAGIRKTESVSECPDYDLSSVQVFWPPKSQF